jgi:hypothetical protein
MPVTKATKKQAVKALMNLAAFIPEGEFVVLTHNCLLSEEKQYFRDMVVELDKIIATMPKTMEQDGKGDNAIAYLHYFSGLFDWYITEKDMEPSQLQAFGLVHMYETELGYISITELVRSGVELDLYWTPKTIGAIKNEKGW